ncbi:MAG: nucleotidyl transferase AbiEii/AbiGii toxin family protein [Motiliproteus sp.]|nr:nucleotidyl transferase AbiEii/AbiGii toxin family protein [Motiliproteus sp.]MCW9053294.1 nucleotidyl transferase AbiEii/AbiGii toxin family protein [Motiliproteus sp.]
MNIFDFYADSSKHSELSALFTLGAQKHPAGLADNFLEKDIWVTEILRLLYEEGFVGGHNIAFKGGTALSKCWQAIERFSEDIDLSIHWADLAEEDDETAAWAQTTKNRSQQQKFRKKQAERLEEWSADLVHRLNERFAAYNIDGLKAELEPESKGEKIDIHFPRVTSNENRYQLDHILLEFGARNRGRPTIDHSVSCYLSEIEEFSSISMPQSVVKVFDPAYILWEKLTALHQFSTQTREPNPSRLARHWYDVDCLMLKQIADPFTTSQAMHDVVKMKKQRWAESGVNYEEAATGKLKLVPDAARLGPIAKDHEESVNGSMFFTRPDSFDQIIERITTLESDINAANDGFDEWFQNNHQLVCSGAWCQGVIELKGSTFRSVFSLIEKPERSLLDLQEKIRKAHA